MAKPADTISRTRTKPDPESAHRIHRRRRPTGAPPPLPRKIGRTGVFWLAMTALLLSALLLGLHYDPWFRLADRADTAALRWMSGARTGWLTDAARAIKAAGSGWTIMVLGLGTCTALMIFRRWRHLLVMVGTLAMLEFFLAPR